jgi:ATP-binding cassette subfamily B (MDR/TAP) protein 1
LCIVNVGTVITVLFSIMIGSFSLAMLAPEVAAVTSAMGAAAKLFATIDRVPAIDSADPGGLKPEKVAGEIELKDVRFHYPTRPEVEVLKGVSLVFKAGETTALVGASGCGKSTIVALIERFYDPSSGSVALDGTDIKELNVRWLRTQIGLVSQEPVLFSMSIRANVELGLTGTPLEHASDDERLAAVHAACAEANADAFVNALPQGYDTPVGERGFLLSGGQKQRIAIARAIISNPPILLLDEATSALDTQSEGIVQNALDKAAAGRTTIVIAHRLVSFRALFPADPEPDTRTGSRRSRRPPGFTSLAKASSWKRARTTNSSVTTARTPGSCTRRSSRRALRPWTAIAKSPLTTTSRRRRRRSNAAPTYNPNRSMPTRTRRR